MTHFYRLFEPVHLYTAVEDKLIKVQQHPTEPLSIYNYTDKAMWTAGAWDNPAVRACRGLIVDNRSLKVVARPWAKFFNHGQKEAAEIGLDELVEVYDKLDGSLGICYLDQHNRPRIATRGSFTSDQAEHATAWLREAGGSLMFTHYPNVELVTPLFEIVYPENRIVCDYGDRDELVLLGGVDVQTGEAYGADVAASILGWRGSVAERQHPTALPLREALTLPPREGKEGYVIRATEGRSQRLVKVKQEDYIALHRIVTGLSERSVWERMMAGDVLADILEGIPDELHGWVDDVYSRLRADQKAVRWQALAIHRSILDSLGASECASVSRKDYAEQAKQHTELRPYLFMLLDGKDIWDAVLKTLKPAGDKRPINRKEEVA